MNLTAAAKYQLLRMEAYAKFPYFIEIRNEDFGVLRYVNSDEDKVFEGELYKAGFFTITPPERNESSISNAKITMSAIDQTWISRIRQTQKRSSIRFCACIQYEADGTEVIEPIDEIEFTLTSVTWDDVTITWDMIFDDNMNIMIPCDIAGPLNVPGCA